MGPESEVIRDSILIIDGKIEAFGKVAKQKALEKNIETSNAGSKLIAPLLVDLHSILEEPLTGHDDNLEKLKFRAKKSGFGVVALLPNSNFWRDRPEKIPFQKNIQSDIKIFFWGSFSLEDKGGHLSPHKELLDSGAVGLSSSNFFDSSIIFKGLKLDAINYYPILFSLISRNPNNKGIVQKDIKSIQSGFYLIEDYDEISHIKNFLLIKNAFPCKKIIIKSISDANSLKEILNSNSPILTTINWWNLIADTSNLNLDDIGWKVDPPLGSAENRENLIKGLDDDLIHAIAVNSYPLNDENSYMPINERTKGISSFELFLPLLWEEFINKRKWSVSKLWKYLSFKPSDLLGINMEKLSLGSKRWLLFDPNSEWINNQINLGYDSPSNFPMKNERIKGKVVEVGLDY